MTRLFPNLSTKIEQLSYRINRLSVHKDDSNDSLDVSNVGSDDTIDLLDKAMRRRFRIITYLIV